VQSTPNLRGLLKARADLLTEDEAGEVLDYISVMQSMSHNVQPDPLEELIMRLLVEAELSGTIDSSASWLFEYSRFRN
jgi:hypothetical protein